MWAEINGIEDNIVLPNEMLYHYEESAFAERRVENHLEVFQKLLETLHCPMAKDKLYAVFLQVFLLNFADDTFEMYDHYHLIFVRLSTTKIESAALGLINSLSFRFNAI